MSNLIIAVLEHLKAVLKLQNMFLNLTFQRSKRHKDMPLNSHVRVSWLIVQNINF